MSDGNEFQYDFEKRSDEARLFCDDPSLAVQSDAIDADINTIVKRFGITGKLPENLRIPSYGDYDHIDDFQSALEQVKEAEREFMRIPADIRFQFGNDPGAFLDYASDPANFDGLVELGLAKAPLAPVVTETPPSPVANPSEVV